VSKRPTAGTSKFSRLRLPMGWLRNAPIWSKLGLIMIVPTIATIVVGMAGLVDNINRASDADRARTLAGLTAESGSLAHELQNERADATFLLGAPSNDARTAFDRQAAATDDAYKRYRLRRSALADLPGTLRDQLNDIDNELSDLAKQREQIRAGSTGGTTLSNVIQRYSVLIGNLVGIRGSAAQLSSDEDLGADMRAAASLSEAKEFLAEERVVVLQALLQKSMPQNLKVDFISKFAGRGLALQQFNAVAPPSQRALFEQTVTGSDQREAQVFESTIRSLTSEELPSDLGFDAGQWDNAMIGQANLMRKVESALDSHVVVDSADLRDQLQRQVLVETGLLLAMLLLAILFAWMVARSMARSLRELRHGALTVAQYGLPQAVARLRDPQLATQASPHTVALQIAEPLPVRSRDEFGQVAEAFNAVHLEAVRTAAEQAALRASVATMFVNLARRSQILVDRLIGHLDRLERGEEDPDRLSELFQLDHLATRMRRNDENLLVLAGADSTRIQREPAPLTDVLRAAQSEVEHYTRIEFGMIDRDVEIAAHAVNDMVHLIAELLDNATAFSPPDSAVVVEARRVGDRAVLLVEDRGIGISPDQLAELNERLANPPVVDVAVSRMMGLVVVARLAARHGVKVELRPARERGTIADLTLPASVLVPRALAGRGGLPIAGSREGVNAGRPAGAPPRSPFGPPLALESGPSIPPREPANAGSGFPSLGGGAGRSGTPSSGGLGAALNGSANSPFVAPSGPPGARLFGDGGPGGPGGPSGPGGPGGPAGPGAPTHPGGPGLFGGSRPTSGAPVGNGAGSPLGGAPGTHPQAPGRGQPPAWSDLIGANGADPHAPRPTIQPPRGDRLPQRRATEHTGPDFPSRDEGHIIPRQRPVSPDQRTEDAAFMPPPDVPAEAQASAAPPEALVRPEAPAAPEAPARPEPLARPEVPVPPGLPADRPAGVAPAAPPAWPPVPQAAEPEAAAGAETPQVPEAFSAALDMTAEMPRVRVDWGQSTDQPATNAPVDGAATADNRQRFADETMELPIFRELESAWFRTQGGSAPAPDAPAPAAPAASSGIPASRPGVEEPVVQSAERPGVPVEPAESPMPSAAPRAERPEPVPAAVTWHTAADEGWQAASALAEDHEFSTTATGLPKRVPMSQLVPGGVEKGTVSAHKRTPEAVRGLLSAYHRGVQRGRSSKAGELKTPEHTTAGPQNSQGGKEQEA
jgi:signal transduction histidine kinase